MLRKYHIQIYTIYKNQIPKISFVQHDTKANEITFEIFEDVGIPMTGIITATATVKRPDNNTYTYGMSNEDDSLVFVIAGNLVTFILPPSALYLAGECQASISLYDTNNGRLSTQTFKYTVTEDLVSNTPIDSTNEYPILTKLINDTQAVKDQTESQYADALALSATNANLEIVDARHDNINNKDYNNIGDRLDSHDSQLNEKANQSDVDNADGNLQAQINSIVLQGTSGDSSAEIAQARVDTNGSSFQNARTHIQNIENKIDGKTQKLQFYGLSVKGQVSDTTGEIITSYNSFRSLNNKFNIPADCKKITITRNDSNYYIGIYFYDSTGAYIQSSKKTWIGSNYASPLTIDVTNYSYFRISLYNYATTGYDTTDNDFNSTFSLTYISDVRNDIKRLVLPSVNGYINTSGVLSYDKNWETTEIVLKKGEKISFTVSQVQGANILSKFTSTWGYSSAIYVGSGTSYTNATYDYIATDDVEYLKISHACLNGAFKLYKYVTYNTDRESILYGKKISIIGDSYVANNTHSVEETWHYKLADKYHMIYNNKGINGDGLVGVRNGLTPVKDRISNDVPTDSDYVVVIGGENDYNISLPLDDFKAGLDTIMLNYLQGVYVQNGAKVCFFIPWNRGTNTVLNSYSQAIIDKCKYYSIPVFNSLEEAGLYPMLGSNYQERFYQAIGDTSHLNEVGHNYFYQKAEKFMLGL